MHTLERYIFCNNCVLFLHLEVSSVRGIISQKEIATRDGESVRDGLREVIKRQRKQNFNFRPISSNTLLVFATINTVAHLSC